MRKAFVFFVLILSAAFQSFAQQAMSSLLKHSDAAALSSGGASVAMSAGAFVLENNSAAMSFSEKRMDVGISYGLLHPGATCDNMVGVGAFGKIGQRVGIGALMNFVIQKPYQILDSDGIAQQVNGIFRPGENNFSIGVSCLITSWLSMGANIKLATSKLAPSTKAVAGAADIYAAFRTPLGLNVGVGVCNLGTKAKYSETSVYGLPSLLRLGASYAIAGVGVNAEMDYLFSNTLMTGVSVSYWYEDYVGLTVGYHYGAGVEDSDGAVNVSGAIFIPSYVSLGLGAQFMGIHFDFAYLMASSAIKNTLCCAIGYNF